jgi:CRISPR-associated protein Csx17
MRYILGGIAHNPLGSYLAGIGAMRAIEHSQVDPQAKFWWEGLTFWCETEIPAALIVDRLLQTMDAKPYFNPWNNCCGIEISPTGDLGYGKTLAKIVDSDSWRTMAVRALLAEIAPLMKERAITTKEEFIARCIQGIGDLQWQNWANSTVVPNGKKIHYPAMLGTGGNVGNVDIAENYHTAFCELFDVDGSPTAIARDCLDNAIFGTSSELAIQSKDTKGVHLFPHSEQNLEYARSVNLNYPRAGVGSSASINPAAIVLATEGLTAFCGLCADFGQRKAAKYSLAVVTTASAVDSIGLDERKTCTEEYFLPLWGIPHTHTSLIAALFVSPLADPDRFYLPSGQIKNGTDWIIAVVNWVRVAGVGGKIARYSFLPRKAKSTSLAVCLDVFDPNQDSITCDLAADLASYCERVKIHARSTTSFIARSALYNFEREFNAFTVGRCSYSKILVELSKVAHYLDFGGQLRSEWLDEILKESNSPELRLAVALASRGIRWLPDRLANIDIFGLCSYLLKNWHQLDLQSNVTPIQAPFQDILAFIKGSDFSDREFVAWVFALKNVVFNPEKCKSINFIDSKLTISQLPVVYKIAAIDVNSFPYKNFTWERVAYSGDLHTTMNRLRGAGFGIKAIANCYRFAPDRRAAAALVFPVSGLRIKLLAKNLNASARI